MSYITADMSVQRLETMGITVIKTRGFQMADYITIVYDGLSHGDLSMTYSLDMAQELHKKLGEVLDEQK